MKKVVVIGGGVAAKGFASAALALHNNIDLTVVRSNKRGPVPCGIPYAFGTLKDANDNISSDQGLIDNGLKLVINDVTEINRENKTVTLNDNSKMDYDKLVISTGSLPVLPPFKGINLDGIHVIEKDLDVVVELRKKV
ncbi:FAD-dependent oxidoreductase, partial [Clostridiaceae bacterium HSG29]|nr:FAD-dependent oxidoreductase [Clostridiaceae bacterium HSG29]